MDPMQDLSLDTLAEGGAVEQFNEALERVLVNIRDLNMDPKAARGITLKVKLKPTEDRKSAIVSVDVTTSLASPRRLGQTVFIGERNGKPVAVTHDTRQGNMFEQEVDEDGTVTPIRRTS